MGRPLYEHTQAGWPIRIASLATSVILVMLAALPELSQASAPPPLLLVGAAFSVLIGWTWGALTVRIQGDELQARFGFGWPRKTVKLADIAAVEITRTTFLEGWGLRYTRRGWLYNVAGFDALMLGLTNGRSLLVGTDETKRLKAAIERARARS